MELGYIKAGTFTPKIRVADVEYNVENMKRGIDLAIKNGVHVLAFPELCLTGYTAGDLFYQKTLLDGARRGLKQLADYTVYKNIIIFIGLPFFSDGLIYNVCAVVNNGKVLGIVPKSYLPNYSDFYEKRYFAPADDKIRFVKLGFDGANEQDIPFGRNIIFSDSIIDSFKISAELCEDLWSAVPPSLYHAVAGARVIVNLSASPEFSNRTSIRRDLVKSHSSKIACGYVYANAGDGESTTDCVFSGHSMIAENGELLAETIPFSEGLCTAEIDLNAIDYERSKSFNQNFGVDERSYYHVKFNVNVDNEKCERVYDKYPFIREGEEDYLINICANGLKKRIEHVCASKLVIGVSGGLDSTLALITATTAMELLGRSSKDVVAITMPCFGTSERTFDNSVALAKAFGTTLLKIDITKSVKRHLKDIDHSEELHDAAYENAQARERTQVLMDYANSCNGLVIGTGDLSELALGWATYNGDHMSMYSVNGSIPKTLVRHLVKHQADNSRKKLKSLLYDILDTPISPELIPANDKGKGQVTEDIVGPYVLHDFFLYCLIKKSFTPVKIYHVAKNTFKNEFDSETILKWLKTFIKRFFSQQFKRSCLPDGVKVSEISLSPRGSYRMPSDAVAKLWLEQLEKL